MFDIFLFIFFNSLITFFNVVSVVNHQKYDFTVNLTFEGNQEIIKYDLPNDVYHFTFESNRIIKNGDIPNSVTHLTFGYFFNQKIDNITK